MAQSMEGNEFKTFIENLYGGAVESDTVEEVSMDGEGGAGPSKMTRITFTSSGKQVVLVLKQTRNASDSLRYGLTREVDFYLLNKDLTNVLPHVYGAMKTVDGVKSILMEQMKGTQLGYYFGPGSPHNWNRELPTYPPSSQVAQQAFEAIAQLHRKYWGKKEELLSTTWLRGVDFLQGNNKEYFLLLQGISTNTWAKIKHQVTWDPFVCALLDASYSRISWEDFQNQNQTRVLTMTHGDFHPGNCFLREDGTVAIFDWEMVGVGNGPQDLGQFVISHMDPKERRESEVKMLDAYYSALSIDDYPRHQLTLDYAMGGACRWLWFLPMLSTIPIFGEKAMHFFVSQVAEFCHDHNITPQNIEMPRV
jgi:hypothetical protein